MPEPRLLYRLPELLAAESAGPLFLVEGEKASDALAHTGLTVTTSPGGSSAAQKADWSPLEGREVVVWPDADELGKKYADAVTDLLTALNPPASVRVLDPAALFDGEGDPPAGWDAADFLNEQDATEPEALRERVVANAIAAPPAEASGTPETGNHRAGRPPSHGTRMVELADGSDIEPFHDPEGERFITFADAGGVRQTHRLRTRGVRDWLAKLLYAADGAAPGSEATEAALNILAARALFDGPCRTVAVRLAEHPRGVVLDLGGPDWRGVLVTADGWEVKPLDGMGDEFKTRFVRPRGLWPLPEPERGATLADLRPFVNVADDGDFALLLGWLTAVFMQDGPFPVLILNGEQGCAKSSTAKVLRRLTDPNKADLRRPPKRVEDLVIAAKNGHVIALENLSAVKADLSDDLCSLSTGAGFSTRTLYTNDEEALFAFRRPIILNGIPSLADRPDLLDRAVTLVLPVIAPKGRRLEKDFWPEFRAARPRLLGALLDAVSTALRNLPGVTLADPPRMADFATRADAAEPAFPVPPGTFLDAYAESREAAHEVVLEGEVLSVPVRTLADRGLWEGTATDLLAELAGIAGETVAKRRSWPGAANALSGRLRRIAPVLPGRGVTTCSTTGRWSNGPPDRLRTDCPGRRRGAADLV